MNFTRRHAVLLLVALGACESEAPASEPWMAPPKVGGKADAIATLTGEDIPSDFADDDATYLHDRSIDALAQVGALSGTRLDVAYRADGIIDALPADGRLDVEELVRMEESPYFDLMFPEEQEALPTLWPVLEVPDTPTETFGFEEVDPLELDDRTVEPGELQLPDWMEIAEFSSGVRDALRRMELAFDDDGDDNTVALGDIDGALASPGAFTPAEIADLEAARDEYIARGESLLSAVTGVPTPGETIEDVAHGEVTISRTTNTTLSEVRQASVRRNSHSQSYRVSIDMQRDTVAWPTLQEGQQLLVIETLEERDQVLDADPRSLAAGVYLVELWEGGVRTDVMWAELPELGDTVERLAMDERVSHQLETFDGTPLQRNIRSTTATSSNWNTQYRANYTWDVGPEEPTGTVDNGTVNTLAIPRTGYTPGRYEVNDDDGQPLVLDIFPEGALRATYQGHTAWMHLNSNGSSPQWARRYSSTTGDRYVHYQVAENRLQAWRNSSSSTHYFANIYLQLTDRQG